MLWWFKQTRTQSWMSPCHQSDWPRANCDQDSSRPKGHAETKIKNISSLDLFHVGPLSKACSEAHVPARQKDFCLISSSHPTREQLLIVGSSDLKGCVLVVTSPGCENTPPSDDLACEWKAPDFLCPCVFLTLLPPFLLPPFFFSKSLLPLLFPPSAFLFRFPFAGPPSSSTTSSLPCSSLALFSLYNQSSHLLYPSSIPVTPSTPIASMRC